ncbi:hypothetical protein H6P81_003564 [Aristolochia fimbriata]|uniref:Uncharacterized protein n=1 Tax=Aristolochia fimbriata TaxID=158543 RepID=A0AAV7FG52_ARIFI|nr:hypothetical protein H6P81_003564 [Aristolochia fimbriata]
MGDALPSPASASLQLAYRGRVSSLTRSLALWRCRVRSNWSLSIWPAVSDTDPDSATRPDTLTVTSQFSNPDRDRLGSRANPAPPVLWLWPILSTRHSPARPTFFGYCLVGSSFQRTSRGLLPYPLSLLPLLGRVQDHGDRLYGPTFHTSPTGRGWDRGTEIWLRLALG